MHYFCRIASPRHNNIIIITYYYYYYYTHQTSRSLALSLSQSRLFRRTARTHRHRDQTDRQKERALARATSTQRTHTNTVCAPVRSYHRVTTHNSRAPSVSHVLSIRSVVACSQSHAHLNIYYNIIFCPLCLYYNFKIIVCPCDFRDKSVLITLRV